MSITEIAAWWGAIIATAVLVWDVYKWRNRGAQLRFESRPDFFVSGARGTNPSVLHIMFSASNVGSLPSTLETLWLDFYPSLLKRVLNKPTKTLLITPYTNQPLPYLFNPGTNWTAWMPQAEFEELIKGGHLVASLRHSSGSNLLRHRIGFRKKKKSRSKPKQSFDERSLSNE